MGLGGDGIVVEHELVSDGDPVVAAQVEEGDGYAAALTNFRFIANAVWGTHDTVTAIDNAYGHAHVA